MNNTFEDYLVTSVSADIAEEAEAQALTSGDNSQENTSTNPTSRPLRRGFSLGGSMLGIPREDEDPYDILPNPRVEDAADEAPSRETALNGLGAVIEQAFNGGIERFVGIPNVGIVFVRNLDASRPARRRKWKRRLSDDECIQLVEEEKKDDDPCPICMEQKTNMMRLIHRERRDGDGKENKCKTPLCFECMQMCIRTQSLDEGESVLKPQCPCCRGEIYKAVYNNVVLDLVNFEPGSTTSATLDDAERAGLKFCFNQVRNEAGGSYVLDWGIAGPNPGYDLRDDYTNVKRSTEWHNIWRFILFNEMRNMHEPNLPTRSALLKAVEEKLKSIGEWTAFPPVYRLSFSQLVEKKANASKRSAAVVDLSTTTTVKLKTKRKRKDEYTTNRKKRST
jgi:hypothetical protein